MREKDSYWTLDIWDTRLHPPLISGLINKSNKKQENKLLASIGQYFDVLNIWSMGLTNHKIFRIINSGNSNLIHEFHLVDPGHQYKRRSGNSVKLITCNEIKKRKQLGYYTELK